MLARCLTLREFSSFWMLDFALTCSKGSWRSILNILSADDLHLFISKTRLISANPGGWWDQTSKTAEAMAD